MKNLENFLEGYSIFEKRSALYYLGRYVKQADSLEDYTKDIFFDSPESNPSEKIQLLTLEMIEFIEMTAEKKASEFNEAEFYFWMDKIAELEDTIDVEPSEEQIQKALNELEKFDIPKIGDNSN